MIDSLIIRSFFIEIHKRGGLSNDELSQLLSVTKPFESVEPLIYTMQSITKEWKG